MPDFARPKGLTSGLSYRDPKAAIRWLEQAFGFEPVMILLDANDNVAHSELRFGQDFIMIGSEWDADHKSPQSLDGKNTQSVHLQLNRGEDVDAHCARARKAGAVILQEPTDQFYGDRVYRARDPEGHIWTVSVTVKDVTPDEWDKASGLRTKTRLD